MLTLQQKVKILCDVNHITVAELEKSVGFTPSTISKWDSSKPSGERLLKVAQYFGITLESLLINEGQFETDSELDKNVLITDIVDLLGILNFSENSLEIAKDMLISIKKNVDGRFNNY